jgi:hypothetical protein
VFALAGVALVHQTRSRTVLRAALLGTSALVLVVLASFFGRGYYLA